MILFHFPQFKKLATKLQPQFESTRGRFEIHRYPKKELYAYTKTKVGGKNCVLLGTIAPPDENLLTFSLVAHTLKKEGAASVTALLPYLAYSRHDKIEAGKSLGTHWVGELLSGSGVDEVVTIDVHSSHVVDLFPMPLKSISSNQLFTKEILNLNLKDVTMVAPDEGAKGRCQEIARQLRITNTAYFKKVRTDKGVVKSTLFGQPTQKAVIIDDILDTGETLLFSCRRLQKKGVKEIYIFITHGLFTGVKWKKLWNLGVKRIYTTDTTPTLVKYFNKIIYLPVAGLLKDSLTEWSRTESLIGEKSQVY